MKFVIQRVNHAKVTVEKETVGEIGKGLLIFLGAGNGDDAGLLERCADKITK
ncbi:MAG: D-aminoacyl-tRNA deacylase, partial [Clostridiaceae bacterium]|nr:D-aminoacyl-tRNA deacylase [Clostridiaceae bacterium]